MDKHYTLENKPEFKDGDIVRVDMAHLGLPNGTIKQGKIVGKSIINVIDHWMIEFPEYFSDDYKFKVLNIPHVAILVHEDKSFGTIPVPLTFDKKKRDKSIANEIAEKQEHDDFINFIQDCKRNFGSD